jgi:hypothetical protein
VVVAEIRDQLDGLDPFARRRVHRVLVDHALPVHRACEPHEPIDLSSRRRWIAEPHMVTGARRTRRMNAKASGSRGVGRLVRQHAARDIVGHVAAAERLHGRVQSRKRVGDVIVVAVRNVVQAGALATAIHRSSSGSTARPVNASQAVMRRRRDTRGGGFANDDRFLR